MIVNLPDRGGKHKCSVCSTLFYDLKKLPAVCPSCGKTQAVVVKEASPYKSRRKFR